MKTIYNRLALPVCMVLVGFLSSCSMFDDFLTVYPTNQITGEQFWEDKNDLTSVVAACYKQLTEESVSKRIAVWGEVRSDNFILRSENDENLKDIMNANLLPTNSWYNWASFYKGIGYCNLVLARGADVIKVDPSFGESDWAPIAAECKTLRALYYFYLVRAFRDVPFNISSTDTSEGVRDPMPQVPSQDILTFLINDLEGCKDDGMTNYGTDVQNRTRITKDAIYTLLADLYLWRAAKNTSADSAAKYPGMAKADYEKCVEYCDVVIANKLYEFQKEREPYYGSKETSKTPVPLYEPTTTGRVSDEAYNFLFGDKCSYESIFEVAFDGSSTVNTMVRDFYGGHKDGSVQIGNFAASTLYDDLNSRPDNGKKAYSKTDLRAVEAVMYTGGTSMSTTSQIMKFIPTSITVLDPTNVRYASSGQADNVIYGGVRAQSTMDADLMIYRTSDVMLMKAEALTCLCQMADDPEKLEEAWKMAYAVFDRSNPAVETKYRLSFDNYSSPSTLLSFIMRERQREFFGEGKRWFDLVRLAIRENSTVGMLDLLTVKYTSNAEAIKAKLATLNSLYSPVYKEEMKINTALKQNEAWVVDETIVRN